MTPAEEGILLWLLREAEGCRLEAYLDALADPPIWTVGYGCTGPGIVKGTTWTQDQADAELEARALVAWGDAAYAVGVPWDALSTARRCALADMAYELGRMRLLGFHQMLYAIQKGDWPQAYKQALASKWAKQVPGRAKRDSTMLRDDTLPWIDATV